MYYTIYQTTCLTSGWIYIGKHQTKDLNDKYIGSGKLLHEAIKHFGLENFSKEILHVFQTEEEMNAKEAELVTEDFCSQPGNFNLCPGGKGGWGYINQNPQLKNCHNQETYIKISNTLRGRKNPSLSDRNKILHSNGTLKAPIDGFKGKKHSLESRIKIAETMRERDHQKGKNNSQFGTKRIKNIELMQFSRVQKEHLDHWLSNGWELGGFKNGIGQYIKLSI
jgi:hypothetical protein